MKKNLIIIGIGIVFGILFWYVGWSPAMVLWISVIFVNFLGIRMRLFYSIYLCNALFFAAFLNEGKFHQVIYPIFKETKKSSDDVLKKAIFLLFGSSSVAAVCFAFSGSSSSIYALLMGLLHIVVLMIVRYQLAEIDRILHQRCQSGKSS